MKLPKYIDIELNTSCNLNCRFCPYVFAHKYPKFMDIELYKKIIDEIDWKASIKLCQRGEPLLSPILIDAIKIAHKKGLRVCFNTNAFYLDEFIEPLLNSGVEEIIISDYDYDIQLENVMLFSLQNIPKRVKIHVKTTKPDDWIGIADSTSKPIFYDYSDKENEDDTELPNWKCNQLFERLVIDPDGKVRCCCGTEHFQKYVGDLNVESIKDIWESRRLRLYRFLHEKGLSHKLEMCRKCGYRKGVIKNEK